jgi:hypothetical protein
MTKELKATLVSVLLFSVAACGSSSNESGNNDGSQPGLDAGGTDETGGKAPGRGGSGVDGGLVEEDGPASVQLDGPASVELDGGGIDVGVTAVDGPLADAPTTVPDAPAAIDVGIDSSPAEVGLHPTLTLTATSTRTLTALPTGTATSIITKIDTMTGTITTTATDTKTIIPTFTFTNTATRVITSLPTGTLTGVVTSIGTLTDTTTTTGTLTDAPTITRISTGTRTLIDPTLTLTATKTLVDL